MKTLYKIGLVAAVLLIAGLGTYTYRDSVIPQPHAMVQQPVINKSAALPKVEIPEDHKVHYMRMKHLNNCHAGYAFFARWANVSMSFNKIHGLDHAEADTKASTMFALAMKKHTTLKEVILASHKKGVDKGVNGKLLMATAQREFKAASHLLEQAFLLSSVAGPEHVGRFFAGIIVGDAGCQKLVSDILSDKDLVPGYYDQKEKPKGQPVSYRNQK